jgi:hypothetical protein
MVEGYAANGLRLEGRDRGCYLSGTVAVGGRIMKMMREQLFAAPKLARRAEERLERGKVGRKCSTGAGDGTALRSAVQPRLPPMDYRDAG